MTEEHANLKRENKKAVELLKEAQVLLGKARLHMSWGNPLQDEVSAHKQAAEEFLGDVAARQRRGTQEF